MIIDPKKVPRRDCYKLLLGGVVPRPIAFVSTLSPRGVPNLAPFSFFNALSAPAPMICFSPGQRPGGGRKDTLANIEALGEFVVNVVTEGIGPQMNETATDFPPDTNEFEAAGLTPLASRIVRPPRVKESPINMECKLYQVVDFDSDKPGGGALVIGEIVLFHVDDSVYDDGRIDYRKMKPLGRLAGPEYTTLGNIVAIKRKTYQPKNS